MNALNRPKYQSLNFLKQDHSTNINSFDKKDLWYQCEKCKHLIFYKEWESNLKVCIQCNYHARISAKERIPILCDSFEENSVEMSAIDPLKFKIGDLIYAKKLELSKKATQLKESVICGRAQLENFYFHLIIFDFLFLGGSLGTITGEKIILQIDEAIRNKEPLVIVTSSGGARIQEGIYALMQMPRILVKLSQFFKKKLLYISILSNPSMGGSLASFASLGDFIIAEPNALIGFTGRNVIEKTIQKVLPEDFQSSEFLLKKGFIDRIINRNELKKELAFYFQFFCKEQESKQLKW